ncbi:MAG: hypothetical protein EBW20_03150 [Betaproteobacteria bacterium]|nr:hypothetical protein [Betaproteobacteria bacterium]
MTSFHSGHVPGIQAGRRTIIKAGSSLALTAASGFPMLAQASPLFESILMFVPARCKPIAGGSIGWAG